MTTGSNFLPFLAKAMNKEIDFDSDSIKALLLTSSYTPDLTQAYKSALTNEASGTNYTAGGVALTSLSITTTLANSWGTSRANSTAYTAGQVIRPASGNGFLYQVTTAGTSGGSVPTFPTVVGQTVTDGTAVLTCVGRAITVCTSAAAVWSSSTITARYVAVYDGTPGSDATRPLICLQDFGSDQVSTAGTFQVSPDATLGWFYLFT